MDNQEDECRASGEQPDKQDAKETAARLEEVKNSIDAKMALRLTNLNPERPDSVFLRTLDSSIKKNTAVIKKLKQINEEQRDGLMEELKSVNLSKFVSEAVAAICDAKLKSSDIQAVVQSTLLDVEKIIVDFSSICSLLHQRYKDFSPILAQGLLKVVFPGKPNDELDTDRNMKAMKKRSTLKLLLELYYVGVVEDSSIFTNIIKDLTSSEHLKDRDTTQTNLTILASFARQGRIFLGLPLSGPDFHDEFFKGLNITTDQKKTFRKAFLTYYDSVTELLQSEHASLRQMEHENAKILNSKGELSDENVSLYEKLRKSYDHLYRNVTSLAEALELQPPVMPEDGHTTRLTTHDDTSSAAAGKDSSVSEAIWDDEDTRAFYECLPDLRAFVPAVLLGETEPKGNEQSGKTQEQLTEPGAEVELGQSSTKDTMEVAADASILPEGKITEKSKDKEEKEKEKSRDPDNKDKGKEKDTDKKVENEKEKLRGSDGANFDSLLQKLPGSVSRDLIDHLTVDFCYYNSKANRKRLVRALFSVPRTSLELLPYYSRLVATLSTCMKDVPSMLVQMLEEEFNFLINKKDQMNIETKIKNIRFLGELCKFKIVPAGLVFSCLKACLDDFTHHNIDVACNLLETCGRFLYRSPETTIRMGNMLEILMRLKNVKNLDPRQSTLVENAYYLCKPPERSARVSKVRPPLHQYIRKLLFSDLDKSSIEHVLRQLRKLPWKECEAYLVKCFLKVHKGKYGQIHLLASLTAGLSRYHDEFAVAVVDEAYGVQFISWILFPELFTFDCLFLNPPTSPFKKASADECSVLEEIRFGLEMNDYSMQQRRIAHMRFLGELYNYNHVDSSVIFETLYLVLAFGYGTPEQDSLDPPEDCFRIRLVITLLQTCGHYFDRGSSRRKLDQFLIHFQRYILSKGAVPLDIEFDLQVSHAAQNAEVYTSNVKPYPKADLFADLRPNMTRYSSVEEATTALSELEENERNFTANSEKHSNSENPANRRIASNSANGEVNGAGENGGLHEEIGGSESDSENSTIDDEANDEDNHDDSEEDNDDGEGGSVSDDDDEVRVRQNVAALDPRDIANFDLELRAVVQESIEQRKLELRGRPSLNMMLPLNVFEGATKDHHGRLVGAGSGDEVLDEEAGGSKEVQVKVLVKRGNKQQTKQMFIPRDSSIVQSAKQKEAADLEEREDIKRLVLEYNDRVEEENNGLGGTQTLNWGPSGGIRTFSRGSSWEGGGRGSGSRHRFFHHSGGGGTYHGRRRVKFNCCLYLWAAQWRSKSCFWSLKLGGSCSSGYYDL
ncbi:hypothetical protein ACFE04_018896 [Oxalis oulophora]